MGRRSGCSTPRPSTSGSRRRRHVCMPQPRMTRYSGNKVSSISMPPFSYTMMSLATSPLSGTTAISITLIASHLGRSCQYWRWSSPTKKNAAPSRVATSWKPSWMCCKATINNRMRCWPAPVYWATTSRPHKLYIFEIHANEPDYPPGSPQAQWGRRVE